MSTGDDITKAPREPEGIKMSLYPWFKPAVKNDGRLELKLDVMTLVPAGNPDGSDGVQPVHVASALLEAASWEAFEAMGQMIADAARKQKDGAEKQKTLVETITPNSRLMEAIKSGKAGAKGL